ncbi:hypothetical protein Tco_0696226 [Tanacetum coccineum]
MFLAPTVSSLMAYFVAILTPNSARSCVSRSTLLQGDEVVIFVNVIVGVVIVVAIIGVVVGGGGVPSIIDLSFVIIGFLHRTLMGYGMIHEDEDNDAIGGNDDERAINNVVEEEDEEQIRSLGGNSSLGTKKYRGSNSNDGGNTEDGVKNSW